MNNASINIVVWNFWWTFNDLYPINISKSHNILSFLKFWSICGKFSVKSIDFRDMKRKQNIVPYIRVTLTRNEWRLSSARCLTMVCAKLFHNSSITCKRHRTETTCTGQIDQPTRRLVYTYPFSNFAGRGITHVTIPPPIPEPIVELHGDKHNTVKPVLGSQSRKE